jgi:hypothetical protein
LSCDPTSLARRAVNPRNLEFHDRSNADVALSPHSGRALGGERVAFFEVNMRLTRTDQRRSKLATLPPKLQPLPAQHLT